LAAGSAASPAEGAVTVGADCSTCALALGLATAAVGCFAFDLATGCVMALVTGLGVALVIGLLADFVVALMAGTGETATSFFCA
jgi:hypothetical protein